MKITCLIPVLAAALLTACTKTPPTASTSTPQQLASESATALNSKDYAKAQALTKQATDIDPKFAEAWVVYGVASLRLGQADQARAAYEQALSIYQNRHLQNPSDANQVAQQILVLSLLGRSDEAAALLKQAEAEYPKDEQISKTAKNFAEVKQRWASWSVKAK